MAMTSTTKETTTAAAFEGRAVADGDHRFAFPERLAGRSHAMVRRADSARYWRKCPPNLAFCDEKQIPFEAALDRHCLWGSLPLTRMRSGFPYLSPLTTCECSFPVWFWVDQCLLVSSDGP